MRSLRPYTAPPLRCAAVECPRGPHDTVLEALPSSTAALCSGGDLFALEGRVAWPSRPYSTPPPRSAAVGLVPSLGDRATRSPSPPCTPPPQNAAVEVPLPSRACSGGGLSALKDHEMRSSTSCTTPPLQNAAVEVSLPSRAALRGPRGSTPLHRRVLRRWGSVCLSTAAFCGGGLLSPREDRLVRSSASSSPPPLHNAAVEAFLPSRAALRGPRGSVPLHCHTSRQWRLFSPRGPRHAVLEVLAHSTAALRSGGDPSTLEDRGTQSSMVSTTPPLPKQRWSILCPRGPRSAVLEGLLLSTAASCSGGDPSLLEDHVVRSSGVRFTPPLRSAAVEVLHPSRVA
ncbi:hypothetical protein FISHEDRAFT_68515 [Fistulina hepatica ATCC 64428]|uniref:Uncharacterized protein n=1 Tax=Fistulina hepatica ATCC 64428 TaxID=1128425 RepID=A0A0D7AR66_9AGAR|nr:hypothetical protein FISHEDRAFT_68515 [Fistulina hepatica ATCC 64428]